MDIVFSIASKEKTATASQKNVGEQSSSSYFPSSCSSEEHRRLFGYKPSNGKMTSHAKKVRTGGSFINRRKGKTTWRKELFASEIVGRRGNHLQNKICNWQEWCWGGVKLCSMLTVMQSIFTTLYSTGSQSGIMWGLHTSSSRREFQQLDGD